jgi:phytanoyl-CoA hydroxylase
MQTVTLDQENQSLSSPYGFASKEVEQFQRDGFVIARGLGDSGTIDRMRQVTREHLEREVSPVEFEAEVEYPGAPGSLDEPGGRTIRRLKQAHARDIVFTEWVCSNAMVHRLSQLLGPEIAMPLAHHNCIMTKQPKHSSDTSWHQDIRYWSYERPELVSVWLALGSEYADNGGLKVIPGSHRFQYDRAQFDDQLFFREDAPANQDWLASATSVDLEPGDVLFFHCRTLHSASRNRSTSMKSSVVFTFRPADNKPRPGSRSARGGALLLPVVEPQT